MLGEKSSTLHAQDNFYPFNETENLKQIRTQIYKFFTDHGHLRSYGKRSTIFHINDPSHEAYVLESGRVRIFKVTPEGKEVTFNIIKAPEMLGLAEVFLGCPRMRYTETMCKTTLWVINREKLFELFFSNNDLCLKILWILHQQVLRYQNIVEDFAVLPVRDRVIKLIVRLCKERGKTANDCTMVIDFPITHEEIAQMVGSSRQTITFILNELRKDGILSWEQKRIKIFRWMDLVERY